MRRPVSRFTFVLALCAILNVLGCSDEVAVTLDEVEAVQQEILALLEQQAQTAAARAAAADTAEENARTALENAGLVLEDNSLGGFWRNKAGGAILCSRDPLCSTWREARQEVRRANSTLDAARTTVDNRANRYARQLANFRRAHEDDTWDLMRPPGATGRSIVIGRLRELQDERTRLENLAAESGP